MIQYYGNLRDREVAASNFVSCVWRAVSSVSSHHSQDVILNQFILYVMKHTNQLPFWIWCIDPFESLHYFLHHHNTLYQGNISIDKPIHLLTVCGFNITPEDIMS